MVGKKLKAVKKQQKVEVATSYGSKTEIHVEDITTAVTGDIYQRKLPLYRGETLENPLWDQYAVFNGLRLLFCTSNGKKQKGYSCNICKENITYNSFNLSKHARLLHRNIQPPY